MSQVYNVWHCDVCAGYHPLYKDCRGKELHSNARRATCDARKAIACGKCNKAFSTDQEAMANKCCYTMLPDMDSHTNNYTPSALSSETIQKIEQTFAPITLEIEKQFSETNNSFNAFAEAFGTLHTIDKDGNMTPLSEIRNIKSITEASQYNESEAITTQAVNSINAFLEALNNLDNAIKIDALRESLDNLGLYQAEAIIRSAMSEHISNGSGINKSITIEDGLCTDELAEQRAKEIKQDYITMREGRKIALDILEKNEQERPRIDEDEFRHRQKLMDADIAKITNNKFWDMYKQF